MNKLGILIKTLILVGFCVMWSIAEANDADLELLSPQNLGTWSALYYKDSSKFCSVAEIADIKLNQETLNVNLAVERQTREALVSMEKADREAWLALHCPPEADTVWNQTSTDFDISIVVPDGSDHKSQLSCRTYHEMHGLLRHQKKQSVLDKIAALLKSRTTNSRSGQ